MVVCTSLPISQPTHIVNFSGEFCYERTLLRARFDQNKDIQDETKSAQVLRLGEEEFWESQHVMPPVFTNSPYGGVMYERFDKYRVS